MTIRNSSQSTLYTPADFFDSPRRDDPKSWTVQGAAVTFGYFARGGDHDS